MCRLWAYADTRSGSYGGLAGMKGETAEGFFSQPGEKFWADAEYAADCHLLWSAIKGVDPVKE